LYVIQNPRPFSLSLVVFFFLRLGLGCLSFPVFTVFLPVKDFATLGKSPGIADAMTTAYFH